MQTHNFLKNIQKMKNKPKFKIQSKRNLNDEIKPFWRQRSQSYPYPKLKKATKKISKIITSIIIHIEQYINRWKSSLPMKISPNEPLPILRPILNLPPTTQSMLNRPANLIRRWYETRTTIRDAIQRKKLLTAMNGKRGFGEDKERRREKLKLDWIKKKKKVRVI